MSEPVYKDKGGRELKGGKWEIFNFIVEVAIERPKEVDLEEASYHAIDFMETVKHTQGRVGECFASITRVDYIPGKRMYPINMDGNKPKQKVKKAVKKKKKVRRI